MKKKSYFMFLSFVLAGMFAITACGKDDDDSDDNTTPEQTNNESNQNNGSNTDEKKTVINIPDTLEAVDLGLPSGTKWANVNLGATTPKGNGYYFAWGETLVKKNYAWETYMIKEEICGHDGDPIVDNNLTDISGTKYDIVHETWGGKWKMPTEAQFQELLDNCSIIRVTEENSYSYYFKFKSKVNDNFIIFPATGYYDEGSKYDEGTNGYYWASTYGQYPSNFASAFETYWEGPRMDFGSRYYGYCIRPVSE